MSNFVLQYGETVPTNAINLAWVSPPPLSPEENVEMINVVSKHPANLASHYREILSSDRYGIDAFRNGERIYSGTDYTYFDSIQAPMVVYRPQSDTTGAWHVSLRDGIVKMQVSYVKPDAWTEGVENYYGDRVCSGTDVYTFIASSVVAAASNAPTGVSGATYWKKTNTGPNWLDKTALDLGWEDGKQLVLIYTLPNIHMEPYLDGSVIDGVTNWGHRGMYAQNEYVEPEDEHTLILANRHVYAIKSIRVNGKEILPTSGVTPLSGQTIQTLNVYNEDQYSCVQSVDWAESVIKLTTSVTLEDVIQVSYYYRAQDYVFYGYYDELLERYCDLDLNPSYGHTYDNGRSSRELLSASVYLYLIPAAAYPLEDSTNREFKYYTIQDEEPQLLRWESGPAITLPSTGSSDSDSPAAIIGGTRLTSKYGKSCYDNNKFMDRILNDSPQVYNEDGSVGSGLQAGGVGSLKRHPHALILAKLFVSPNGILDSVKIVDTRVRGGGVPERIDKTTLTGDELAEMGTYWDVGGWEGDFAMLNGVVVVELPAGLLNGTKGLRQFTEREIEEIVSKHVAAGIKSIIRYTEN